MIINHWHSLKNFQTRAPDTEAPTDPSSLQTSNITATEITLSWAASTDNVAVTGYDLQLNGSDVGSVSGTSYTYTGLSANTSYTLGVRAKDAAGNTSAYATTSQTTASPTPNISVVTTQTFDLSFGGNVQITGIQSGDLVVLFCGDNGTGNTSARFPSNYTALQSLSGNGMASMCGYRFATGTTETVSFPTNFPSYGGIAVVFRNVNSTTPIDTTTPSPTANGSATGTSLAPPNITTTTSNALVLTFLAVEDENNTAGVSPPTGYSNVDITYGAGSSTLVSVDSKLVSSAGTTETFGSSKQYTHPADTSHAYTIALRKA